MIHIIIADDHQLIRDGISKRIDKELDIQVVGEAENAKEAFRLVGEVHSDVLLLDIAMPDKSGLELIPEIKALDSNIKILILSMHAEDQYASRAIQMGASGYITKDSNPAEMIRAIRKVADGRIYVSESFAEKLAFGLKPESKHDLHEDLSPREFQILRLLGAGKTVTQIAHELHLSQSSINTYRTRILEKMQMQTTAQLIHYAIKSHLVE